jgi:hypothetical protein
MRTLKPQAAKKTQYFTINGRGEQWMNPGIFVRILREK